MPSPNPVKKPPGVPVTALLLVAIAIIPITKRTRPIIDMAPSFGCDFAKKYPAKKPTKVAIATGPYPYNFSHFLLRSPEGTFNI